MKTATVRARIDPSLKRKTEMVLHRLGLTTSDAINLLCRQICFRRSLPFPVEIPNEETRKAIAEPIKNARRFKTVDELFRDLEK